MSKEYKFISLQPPEARGVHFKADSGSGTLEGYAAVFGEIDESGDLILPGAFTDTIDEYLSSGFTAHSHDWSVNGVIGYPVTAKEDNYGFYVESKFHSTPDAQLVRTKAQERMAAGKQVGLSIGYQLGETAKYILPKDYEKELPQYLRTDALVENMEKAKKFSKIRLLAKINNFEHSIVTAPMNKLAQAVSVKSNIDVKGLFEDELSERTNSLYNLCDVLCSVAWRITYARNTDSDSQLDEALAEFSARFKSSVLTSIDTTEPVLYMSSDLHNLLSEKGDLLDGMPFADESETVLAAAQGLTTRAKEINELRTKEGRVLSKPNRTRLSNLLESLKTVAGDIETLLAETEPKEKADPALVDQLVATFHQFQFKRLQTTVRR